MKKKKAGIVFGMAAVMAAGLMACQNTGGDFGESSEQTVKVVTEAAETDMELSTETKTALAEEAPGQQERDSLIQAITDSPEYRACAEWQTFLAEYDTDGTIIAEVGNEPVEEGYEYEAYNCYSPEMEQKIDELCNAYGLSKLKGCEIFDDYSALCSKAGIGAFCKDASENVKHSFSWGYVYEDGTFLMGGSATLTGSSIYEASYQFMRVVKGSFDGSFLDFGALSDYDIREYTTQNGETVALAMSADKNPHLIAQREKSYIVINIIADFMEPSDINEEMMEQLADAFDFTEIP